jgi:glucosyl-3-phosphoglycerate synthase
MISLVGTPFRTFRHADFDAADLADARGSLRISVCLPARDEESTVGAIVNVVVEALTARRGGVDLVTDVVVVDDGSSDATATAAKDAGARVVRSAGSGKGEAMAVALDSTDGDVIVFLDADVRNFEPHFVTGLLGPLLEDQDVALVKGFYERPLFDEPTGGGRVTELVARPLIAELFPDLIDVRQPLAGETAAPRTVLDKTGFAPGYGVELGLLIDVAERFGTDSICQVDLGVRAHRNRPLSELRPQAADVLRAALARAPSTGRD